MLHVVMLLVMVHWFLISVTHYLREDFMASHFRCWITLFLLAWLKRDGLKSAFAWLTRHKKRLLAWSPCLSGDCHGLCGLFIRRDAAVVFKGAFDLLRAILYHQLPQSQSQ